MKYLLEETKSILGQRGHTKQVLNHPETGNVCIVGALMFACHAHEVPMWADKPEDHLPRHKIFLFTEAQRLMGEAVGSPIMEWNDRPETTFWDCVTLLDGLTGCQEP